MTAGRYPKYFNEDFFKEQSKIMLYFLGGSFSIYGCGIIPSKTAGYFFTNRWQSSNKTWIEKLKFFLESEHKITTNLFKRICKRDHFETYTLAIGSQKMYHHLKKHHLNRHRKDRPFPENINPYIINHFIRGFADVHFSVCNYLHKEDKYEYKYKIITIHNNKEFNSGLERVLVEHADVKPKKVVTDVLLYSNEDVKKIHDFIYRDWNFIKKHNLYLQGKKEKFET